MQKYLISTEALVTLGLFAVSATFFVSALGLPGGSFDPLGPGAAPEMVAGLLMLLCAIVLGRGLLAAAGHAEVEREDAIDIVKREGEETPYRLAGFFVLLFAYLMAFELRIAHFIVLTIPFIFLATLILGGLSLKRGLIGLAVALVMSFGLFYGLTDFFVIRLPGI